MIEVTLDVDRFLLWLREAGTRFEANAAQALGQSVALALREAQQTTLFKDRTGELRRSLSRGQRSRYEHFLKASAKHALYVEEDTKAHRIEARKASALRFVQSGEVRFRRGVNHPGTTGTHFLAKAAERGADALEEMLEKAAADAFR